MKKNNIVDLNKKIKTLNDDDIKNISEEDMLSLVLEKKLQRKIDNSLSIKGSDRLKKRLIYKALSEKENKKNKTIFLNSIAKIAFIFWLSSITVIFIANEDKIISFLFNGNENISVARENYILYSKGESEKDFLIKNKFNEYDIKYNDLLLKNANVFYTITKNGYPIINIVFVYNNKPIVFIFADYLIKEEQVINFDGIVVENIRIDKNKHLIISASSIEDLNKVKEVFKINNNIIKNKAA